MIIGGERARRSLHTHFSKGAEKKGRIAQLVDQTEKGRHGWYHHRFDSLVWERIFLPESIKLSLQTLLPPFPLRSPPPPPPQPCLITWMNIGGVQVTEKLQTLAAIPLFGHTEILHMLVGMGSTVLSLMRVKWPKFPGKRDNDVLKNQRFLLYLKETLIRRSFWGCTVLNFASCTQAMYSVPKHAMYSVQKHAIYLVQKHAMYSVQKHAMYSVQKHIMYSVQKHAMYSVQKHAMYSAQKCAVYSAQKRAVYSVQKLQ